MSRYAPKARTLNAPRPRRLARLGTALVLAALAGCGTTRLTDTQRTATEQLLVSNAIDQAVAEFDFTELAGKTVYFDPQYLDGVVDRGYLVSSLRHQLLSSGALLQEDRAKANYVVEVRSGSVGTDRHGLLVGVPQMNVPTFVPGQPSQIPEIPLAKTTDQEGVAKIIVFAFNRTSGQIVWQSGVAKATSTSKDTWVFGAGPFQRGTIRAGTNFAGQELPIPKFNEKDTEDVLRSGGAVPLTHAARWPERPAAKADSERLARALSNAPPRDGREPPTVGDLNQTMMALLAGGGNKKLVAEKPLPWLTPAAAEPRPAAPVAQAPAAPAPPTPPPVAPNKGGQAETEPERIVESGLGVKPTNSQAESEPRSILDTSMTAKPEN